MASTKTEGVGIEFDEKFPFKKERAEDATDVSVEGEKEIRRFRSHCFIRKKKLAKGTKVRIQKGKMTKISETSQERMNTGFRQRKRKRAGIRRRRKKTEVRRRRENIRSSLGDLRIKKKKERNEP